MCLILMIRSEKKVFLNGAKDLYTFSKANKFKIEMGNCKCVILFCWYSIAADHRKNYPINELFEIKSEQLNLIGSANSAIDKVVKAFKHKLKHLSISFCLLKPIEFPS